MQSGRCGSASGAWQKRGRNGAGRVEPAGNRFHICAAADPCRWCAIGTGAGGHCRGARPFGLPQKARGSTTRACSQQSRGLAMASAELLVVNRQLGGWRANEGQMAAPVCGLSSGRCPAGSHSPAPGCGRTDRPRGHPAGIVPAWGFPAGCEYAASTAPPSGLLR